MKVLIQQNAFLRFILVDPATGLAWSGSQWVSHVNGVPASAIQVSSLTTYEQALSYAEQFGFEVCPQLGGAA